MPASTAVHTNAKKSVARKLNITERRAKAVELAAAGNGCREIARQLGVSATTISKDINHAVKQFYDKDSVQEYRVRELKSLEMLKNARWRSAMSGNTESIKVCLEVHDRISRLLGLAVPTAAQTQTAHALAQNPVSIQFVMTDDPEQKDKIITIDAPVIEPAA